MFGSNPFDKPNPLYVQCTSAGPGYYAPDARLECILRHKPLDACLPTEKDTVDRYISNRLDLLHTNNPFLGSSRSTAQLTRHGLDLKLEEIDDDMYFSSRKGDTDQTRATTYHRSPAKSPSRIRPFSPSISTRSLTNPFLSAKNITRTDTPFSTTDFNPYGLTAELYDRSQRQATMTNMMGDLFGKSQTAAGLNYAMGGLFERAQTQSSLHNAMGGLFDRAQTYGGYNSMMGGLYDRAQTEAHLAGMMSGLYNRAQQQGGLNNAMAGLFDRAQTEGDLNNAMGQMFGRAQAQAGLNNAMGGMFDQAQAEGNLNNAMGRMFGQAQSQAGLNNGMGRMFGEAQAQAGLNNAMGQMFGQAQSQAGLNNAMSGLYNQAQAQAGLNNAMGRMFNQAQTQLNMNNAMGQLFDHADSEAERNLAEQQYNLVRKSMQRSRMEEQHLAEEEYQLIKNSVERQKGQVNNMAASLGGRFAQQGRLGINPIDGLVASLANLDPNRSRVPRPNSNRAVEEYAGRLLSGLINHQHNQAVEADLSASLAAQFMGISGVRAPAIPIPPVYIDPLKALSIQQRHLHTIAGRGEDAINVEGKTYFRIPMRNPRSASASPR